jgi:hypothetical protein
MSIDVLIENCFSPSGAAYARSDAAPDGACELFLAGAINIPRRWRFRDANPQNQAGSANFKFEISEMLR